MKLTAPALGVSVIAVLLAGCQGAGAETGEPSGKKYVNGGTFTMALTADPGNLDPQSSAQSELFELSQFAYDSLLSVDKDTGTIEKQLANTWEVNGSTVRLTLGEGITCSDGRPFTARDAADNLNYVADPANKSPFLGTFVPVGSKATADDGANQVTLSLASPAPFVLNGLASLPMVCRSGMDNRSSLAKGTAGTGPFELIEVVPGDHFTYRVREGYTWGPNGASTAVDGVPDTVIVKVVPNESTAANLLLSGGLNAARVLGPDATRLLKAGLGAIESPALIGEQFYNQTTGHPTSDPEVRMALTQALDLAELRRVLTSGDGTPATTLAAIEPVACRGDSVSASLPPRDLQAAKAVLQRAGISTLRFVYDSTGSSGVAAAAELAVQQWEAAGVKVEARGQSGTAYSQTLFGTGDWDIAWVSVNVYTPEQLVPFLSGPSVPKGTNFSGIKNSTYESGVKQAITIAGAAGCDTWLKAESALVAAADVVPFANDVVKTFGAKAEFDATDQLIPTSIRMLEK